MKVKTNELSGAALDWAVAQCEGVTFSPMPGSLHYFSPSSQWSHGGPIIERNGISVLYLFVTEDPFRWAAKQKPNLKNPKPDSVYGPTLLIAAMRCYIAAKTSEVVDIPETLKP